MPLPTQFFDRFLATYVLDLLSEEDIRTLLSEAHRMLSAKGLLGIVSLTHGFTAAARLVARAWMTIYALRPTWVGGCRPLAMMPFLDPAMWKPKHQTRIVRLGIASEVLVAEWA